MPAIEVNGLTKAFRTYKKQPGFSGAVRGLFRRQYEQTVAVKDVTFSVESGELVGFLGPNGAGKTTTLKMLAGLLYPTGGSARVLGYVPWPEESALVGFAGARVPRAECANLWHHPRRIGPHRVGNDRIVGRPREAGCQCAGTVTRRADENGAHCLTPAQAQG